MGNGQLAPNNTSFQLLIGFKSEIEGRGLQHIIKISLGLFWSVGAGVTKSYFRISHHQPSGAISSGVYVAVVSESQQFSILWGSGSCKTTQGICQYVICDSRGGTSAPRPWFIPEKVDLGEYKERGFGSGFLQVRKLGGGGNFAKKGFWLISLSSGSKDNLRSSHGILNQFPSFGSVPTWKLPHAYVSWILSVGKCATVSHRLPSPPITPSQVRQGFSASALLPFGIRQFSVVGPALYTVWCLVSSYISSVH